MLQVKCAVRPDLVDGNEALGVAVVAQRDSLAQAVEVLAFQRGADCCGRARIGLPRRLGPQVHRCVRRGRGVERLARAVLGLATPERGVAFGDVAAHHVMPRQVLGELPPIRFGQAEKQPARAGCLLVPLENARRHLTRVHTEHQGFVCSFEPGLLAEFGQLVNKGHQVIGQRVFARDWNQAALQ